MSVRRLEAVYVSLLTVLGIGLSMLLSVAQAAEPTGPRLHQLTAYSCGAVGCHADIFQQWNQSMHANSVPMKDPIHAVFYRQLVGDPLREGVKMGDSYPVCLQCHAPFAALDKRTNLNAKPSYHDGINCMVCHTFAEYKGRTGDGVGLPGGIHDYELSPYTLQGSAGRYFSNQPNQRAGDAATSYHPYNVQPNQTLLKTSKACIGCHDMRDDAKDPAYKPEDIACQACHMPKINGIADHSMQGGHSASMVKQALLISLDSQEEQAQWRIQVTLKNTLPHSFPATMPLRNVTIKVIAYNAQGKVLWENFRKNAASEDPKAILMYKPNGYIGHPPLPVTELQSLADTHLKAKETRVLEYTLPRQDVTLIRAEAHYNLVLPEQITQAQQRFQNAMPRHLSRDSKQPRSAGVAELRF